MSSPDLFNQLLRTVEAIGIDQTDAVLKQAEYQEVKLANKHVEFVVATVANGFGIPIHEIVVGNGRKNDRKYAIGFAAYYLHFIYNYTMDEVKDFLKKDVTLCHKYLKLVQKLSDRHISDKNYLELKKQFDTVFVKK